MPADFKITELRWKERAVYPGKTLVLVVVIENKGDEKDDGLCLFYSDKGLKASFYIPELEPDVAYEGVLEEEIPTDFDLGKESAFVHVKPLKLDVTDTKYTSFFVLSRRDVNLNVDEAVDLEGKELSRAKIYVDGIYVHHWTPEFFLFGDARYCDGYAECGFGEHKIEVKKKDYQTYSTTINAKREYMGSIICVLPILTPSSEHTKEVTITANVDNPEISIRRKKE